MPAAAGMYYTEQGKEKPGLPALILIHGAGMSHQVWPAQLRRLPGWRVLAVDLPGHGQSPGAGFQSIDSFPESLAGLMDALGLFSAILVGHGMGGAAALAFARQFPRRTSALGILSAAARFHLPPRLVEQLSVPAGLQAAADLFLVLLSSQAHTPGKSSKIHRLLQAARPSVLRDDLIACINFQMSLPRSAFTCPTVVITGAQDPIVSLSDIRHLARYIPDCSVHIIRDCGHLPQVEQPAQTTALLSAFLAEKFPDEI